HTRFSRDWSSDVCSSDLGAEGVLRHGGVRLAVLEVGADRGHQLAEAEAGGVVAHGGDHERGDALAQQVAADGDLQGGDPVGVLAALTGPPAAPDDAVPAVVG